MELRMEGTEMDSAVIGEKTGRKEQIEEINIGESHVTETKR